MAAKSSSRQIQLTWGADAASIFENNLVAETIYDRAVFSGALGKDPLQVTSGKSSSAVLEIQEARKKIEASLKKPQSSSADDMGNDPELVAKVVKLEKQNAKMEKDIVELRKLVEKLQVDLSKATGGSVTAPKRVSESKAKADDEEDIDLFGSDEEDDEEKERIKQERLKAYEEKKQKKPALVAKSSVILDVKPWDDETDMAAMEKAVKGISMEGLVWGASKLVPLAYGIKKLQIMCVVEDDKVSIEELQEKIEEFEDFVQSVDIAAFNKI